MATICLDLGGTLIDDPFCTALKILKQEMRDGSLPCPFPSRLIDSLFDAWAEENWNYNFPFASHFLQEEVWLARAAFSTNKSNSLELDGHLPAWLPTILRRYREVASQVISKQPQLPFLRATIKRLRNEGHAVGVASNDRAFATSAMLTYAQIKTELNFIYTSEWLSRQHPGAEKPAAEFFRAICVELEQVGISTSQLIYVGDSELNDIVPVLKVGWLPVRFFNANQPAATWLVTSNSTIARISYGKFEEFSEAIQRGIRMVQGP